MRQGSIIGATAKAAKQVKHTVKEINDNIEHSTLGDIEVLASLKENLEKQENAQKGEYLFHLLKNAKRPLSEEGGRFSYTASTAIDPMPPHRSPWR